MSVTQLKNNSNDDALLKHDDSIDIYNGNSPRSDSVDSGKSTESSKESQSNSGKISVSSSSCERKDSTSSSYSTTNEQISDSGISSPVSEHSEDTIHVRKRTKSECKSDAHYSAKEFACETSRAKGFHSKFSFRIPKFHVHHKHSSSGIGTIVNRIRSISIGVSSSTSGSSCQDSGDTFSENLFSPDYEPDPSKLPKEYLNTSINFTRKLIRSNRKLTRMTHSLSCDVDSFNLHDYFAKSPKGGIFRSVDEAIFLSNNSATNRLEKSLIGDIDTSTPNGALMSVIKHGLRKVSESDRFMWFSKSPMRSPCEFLDLGIEHLGDSDMFLTALYHNTCYDLMPDSGKLVVIDSALPINRAFDIMEENQVLAVPIWSSSEQTFCGILNVEDQMFYLSVLYTFESDTESTLLDSLTTESVSSCVEKYPERHRIEVASPENVVSTVFQQLETAPFRRILVLDSLRSGNPLFILDHRRILLFLMDTLRIGVPIPFYLKIPIRNTDLFSKNKFESYQISANETLASLLEIMNENPDGFATVVTENKPTKSYSCCSDDKCVITVDDIAYLISKSKHRDPSYKISSILDDIRSVSKRTPRCTEQNSLIDIMNCFRRERTSIVLINSDTSKTCIHTLITVWDLLDYIVKYDPSNSQSRNESDCRTRRGFRSMSCCEDTRRESDKNLSVMSLDEKDEDVFNRDML